MERKEGGRNGEWIGGEVQKGRLRKRKKERRRRRNDRF